MKKLILAVFMILGFGASALASDGPCANYAKYGAIRAYKAEFGTIQGSEMEYEAELIQENDGVLSYLVSIYDHNEDGEYWTMEYDVDVTRVNRNRSCKLVKVTRREIEE